jgi:hypothetical protein
MTGMRHLELQANEFFIGEIYSGCFGELMNDKYRIIVALFE